MNIAIYARVSTSNKGQDVDMQLRELHAYCAQRGWNIAHEYVDKGISGSKSSRPQLNRLMAAAGSKKFEAVAVWKFDRFARSTSHLLRALETFQSLGIAFISLTEGIDTSTPVGKLVFTILGAVAEMERELIRERIRCGLRNARAKGKRIGRPSLGIDREQISRLKALGATWEAVSDAIGCSLSTAKRTYGMSVENRTL